MVAPSAKSQQHEHHTPKERSILFHWYSMRGGAEGLRDPLSRLHVRAIYGFGESEYDKYRRASAEATAELSSGPAEGMSERYQARLEEKMGRPLTKNKDYLGYWKEALELTEATAFSGLIPSLAKMGDCGIITMHIILFGKSRDTDFASLLAEVREWLESEDHLSVLLRTAPSQALKEMGRK